MAEVAVALPFNDTLGHTIPPNTPHAVSVSLPTWRSNVGYEEGESWVVDVMQTGYPRFFIHKSIQRLADSILKRYGSSTNEMAMLFPSPRSACRCLYFLLEQNPTVGEAAVRKIDFGPTKANLESTATSQHIQPRLSAVIYPRELWPTAKAFWQHTGEGVQSRRAEFCQLALDDGTMVEHSQSSRCSPPGRTARGPRRYQRPMSTDNVNGQDSSIDSTVADSIDKGVAVSDSVQFVEERFGRNLHVAFTDQAKLAIRRRIAGSLTTTADLPESLNEPVDQNTDRSRDVPGFSTDDVYLFSCGMNAIYTSHRILRLAREDRKSIMYGFPYVDTLKVLEKFGPGAQFYGMGDADDLDDLEQRLQNGERFLSLYCEFPGNPLLKTPDLKRIRKLADQYDFAVVVDETIGNFLNVHVLPYADVVVSSLTKVFSGDSNVMGGAMILNPSLPYYDTLKQVLASEYEDNQFGEDSVYLERNSRDFVSRCHRINRNAEIVAEILLSRPEIIKQVNHPKFNATRPFYDACRLPNGGYGGLLSATFHRLDDAKAFYDHLNTQKGPSLGTNFTLASPFVLLAHYNELEWAAKYGCEQSLVRFSTGLEDPDVLKGLFNAALDAAASNRTKS